jgi:hypothetical protein
MKKVVKNYLYDTHQATQIASVKTDRWEGDYGGFGWEVFTLYRTKNGRWFVHQEVFTGSKSFWFFGRYPEEQYVKEKLIPMSKEEVVNWAIEHGVKAAGLPKVKAA